MACNITDEQSKEFFKDKVRRAALVDAAVDHYINSGNDFHATVRALSDQIGISPEAVRDALRPQGADRAISDQMWLRQAARRQIGEINRRLAESTGTSKFVKLYNNYDAITRRITTYGHFSVFGKTHMGDELFTNPDIYAKNFKNSIALASKKGIAATEQRLDTMRSEADYDTLARYGLDVTPRSEASDILGGSGSIRSRAAFGELQLRRYEIAKAYLHELAPWERTPDSIRAITDFANNRYGGGAAGRIGSLVGKVLFGPRLTPAQWRSAYLDNAKAFYYGVLNRKGANPGQLLIAKKVGMRTGRLFAIYGSLLGLEAAAVNAGLIDKRNMPTINPKDTGNFMRLKILGKGVPLSPMIEILGLPFKMIAAGLTAKPNENGIVKALEPLAKYGLFRLSPGISLGTTLASGQEIFSGRRLPKAIDIKHYLVGDERETTKKGLPTIPSLTRPRLEYTEFLGERMPIYMAVFARDVYDSQRAEGVPAPTASILIKSAIASAMTGMTGYEWHPEVPTPYKQAEAQTPENATDKQRQRILNRAMRDFRRTRSGQPEPQEGFGLFQ